MPIDTGLIGAVINALPIDRMISAPLAAMMTAQVQASKQYADFLLTACIKGNKAILVEFDYDQTRVDTEVRVTGLETRRVRIPLLAAVTHPNICIEEGTIDFELEVSQSEETYEKTDGEGGIEAKIGWGPFSVKLHGKVSHHREQTRKTDTRAKYSIHVAARREASGAAIEVQLTFSPGAVPEDVQAVIDQFTSEVIEGISGYAR